MPSEHRKIAVLHVILSLEIGGMEQMVADLARCLDRRLFQVTVACLQGLGPIADELRACGVRVVQVPAMTSRLSFLYPAPLIAVMRASGARIVHVHSGCWYKTAIAALYCGIGRLVYTEHGRSFPDGRLVILADRLCCRLTGSVVAVSGELADYLREVVRVPADKVSVIVNGIDVDKFPRQHARRATPLVIGAIARLAPVKDLATLLQAMQLVLRERPELTLQVVGDGPERALLERLAERLGLGERVRFLGFRRDIPRLMAGFDIFALSSLSEGTSLTILEAMAAGKPVVATRVGGTPALIEEGVNGLLVAPGDPDQLARALLRLAEDGELRARFGEANRSAAARNYSVQAMTRGYERLYAQG